VYRLLPDSSHTRLTAAAHVLLKHNLTALCSLLPNLIALSLPLEH
jgi:hypothetical protein